jgi:hypothetical protein
MNYASRWESGAVAMKSIGKGFEHACCVGGAGIAMVLLSATPSLAISCVAPAPLIGVTGPYGILAAGIGYGGYLLYKRLKHRD